MITDIQVTTPNNETYPIRDYVIDNRNSTLYFNLSDIEPGSKLTFIDVQEEKVRKVKPKRLKAKSKRSKAILLFSINPNQQSAIITKSGKEYLENIGLWRDFQLMINKQRKT